MFASEVFAFLEQHIKDRFIVTSIDKLPSKFQLPLLLISNLDSSHQKGSHWTTVFISKQNIGIYFDSFGRSPPEEIESFLKKHTESYEHSDVQIQSISSKSCGLFSAVALVSFYRNESLKLFLSNFSPINTYLNEKIIKSMSEHNCIKLI